MDSFIHHTVTYLSAHPHVGGLIALLVAFTESLAIVGTIVPGSVTMTAVGALIGAQVIPAGSTIIWAVIGAFLGDSLSYGLGYRYKEQLQNVWPMKKYPNWLQKGREFFSRHGGKSIIIGRFVGPMRSTVPLVAGILHMKPLRFFTAALPSAAMWALLYMAPGILVGAISLDLPPQEASKFVLYILLLIALLWAFTWLIKFLVQKLWQQIDKAALSAWNYLYQHKPTHWLTTALRNPRYPEEHNQLLLLVTLIICIGAFIGLGASLLLTGSHDNIINQPIFQFLQSIRNVVFDPIFLCVTLLGEKVVLLSATAILCLWLLWGRHYRTLLYFAAAIVGCAISIKLSKLYFAVPRPAILMQQLNSYAFPSGHTALAMTFYSFLAVLTGHELTKEYKSVPYIIATSIAIAVGLSRLYLGAHWLTDVIGGLLLGISWTLLMTILYRRKPIDDIPINQLIVMSSMVTLLIAIVFGAFQFNNLYQRYQPQHPIKTVTFNNWWDRQNKITLYRISPIGRPTQALNVQWLDHIGNIKRLLEKQGWRSLPTRISLIGKHQLPMLPKLFLNKPPVLVMETPKSAKKPAILRLWASYVTVHGSFASLWIGEINYRLPAGYHLSLLHKRAPKIYQGATNALTPELANQTWKIVVVPKQDQPEIMRRIIWNGKLILIHPEKNHEQ